VEGPWIRTTVEKCLKKTIRIPHSAFGLVRASKRLRTELRRFLWPHALFSKTENSFKISAQFFQNVFT